MDAKALYKIGYGLYVVTSKKGEKLNKGMDGPSIFQISHQWNLDPIQFSNLFLNLSGGSFASLSAAKEAGAVTINYGVFVNTIINFIIVAFVLFLMVRSMNKLRRKEEAPAEPTTKDCPFCLSQISIKATRCPHCTSQQDVAWGFKILGIGVAVAKYHCFS